MYSTTKSKTRYSKRFFPNDFNILKKFSLLVLEDNVLTFLNTFYSFIIYFFIINKRLGQMDERSKDIRSIRQTVDSGQKVEWANG